MQRRAAGHSALAATSSHCLHAPVSGGSRLRFVHILGSLGMRRCRNPPDLRSRYGKDPDFAPQPAVCAQHPRRAVARLSGGRVQAARLQQMHLCTSRDFRMANVFARAIAPNLSLMTENAIPNRLRRRHILQNSSGSSRRPTNHELVPSPSSRNFAVMPTYTHARPRALLTAMRHIPYATARNKPRAQTAIRAR